MKFKDENGDEWELYTGEAGPLVLKPDTHKIIRKIPKPEKSLYERVDHEVNMAGRSMFHGIMLGFRVLCDEIESLRTELQKKK